MLEHPSRMGFEAEAADSCTVSRWIPMSESPGTGPGGSKARQPGNSMEKVGEDGARDASRINRVAVEFPCGSSRGALRGGYRWGGCQ